MASIRKKYIGLLGDSFDPAHKGHLSISKIALKKLKLKKIFWVITKKNPFKNKTFYTLYDRKGIKSMVVKNFKNKIVFIKNKHIEISSSQLKSQTKSNN